jgi:hypothetical protein
MPRRSAAVLALVVLSVAPAARADDTPSPSEAAEKLLLGGDDEEGDDPQPGKAPQTPSSEQSGAPRDDDTRSDREAAEDALFGGDEGVSENDGTSADPEPSTPDFDKLVGFEPLSLGGQVYLRFNAPFTDRGRLGAQPFSMPNLVDVYLDARPEDRVRAFVQGRLRFDPTVSEGSRDGFGQPRTQSSVLLDQLWLKTDIARTVFLTIGQERIKWGSSRLWNPTDVSNAQRRDPVVFFDERVGVPVVKVHVPWESFNFYTLLLFGGADRLDALAGAFRAELAFPSFEVSATALAGKDRKTTFGLDISGALGPVDVTVEAALVDERDTIRYSGELDLESFTLPTGTPDGKWRPSISASVTWVASVFDDDFLTLGAEYFWNPGGTDDVPLYPWQILTGSLQPFYLGQHYAALFLLLPSPGTWDRFTFNLSALGNLSDRSFIVRFDTIATIHTRLRLEAFVQGHLGQRGGEFRFAVDVPELPPVPGVLPDGLPAFSVPAPVLSLGVNLRLAL